MGTKSNGAETSATGTAGNNKPSGPRDPETIYQRDRNGTDQPVARVADVEVDEEGKEVRFGEIYDSEELSLSDECEFRKYVLVVRRITYATKAAKDAPEKGRIMRGVVAQIVRYREN